MEKDEFNNILNIDFPEVEADVNQYYEYCINKNKKRVIKLYKSFLFIFCTLIICTISLTTFFCLRI